MPKMTALVDDNDGKTIIVPGIHPYATVVTTIYDAAGSKTEERRLFYAEDSFDVLPGGQKVALKGKRKNGATADDDTETVEAAPARRSRS